MALPEFLGVLPEANLMTVASDLSRRKSRTVALDFAKIDSEIRAGLKNEKVRLSQAWKNRMWFEGRLDAFLSAIASEQNLRMETVRSINLFETWSNLLTKHLYAGSPERIIPDNPEITEYLQKVYSKSNINAIMTLANQYAFVSDVAAIQIEVNEPVDENETQAFLSLQKPAISHRVWPADQFVVWCHPDAPTQPWAVGVIDFYDEQRRLRVWTSDRLVTYTTRKYNADAPWEGTAYTKMDEEKNFLGFVPFSFVHWKTPTSDFWSGGPGTQVQQFTEAVTVRLWKQNDDILNQRPILQAQNVRSDFAIPKQYQAGTMIKLAPVLDQLGEGPTPAIEYAYCDLSYLAQDWEQLTNDISMFGDSIGIPESAWRLKGQSAASGVAIISEQLPLIEASQRRQRMIVQYEQDTALVTLVAAYQYLGNDNGIAKAIEDFDLTVRWGKFNKAMPGPELDQHVQFLLVNNLTSEMRALAMVEDLTHEQAQEQLDKINEERLAQAQANSLIVQASQTAEPVGATPSEPITGDENART